jgi:hypothetical protein
MIRPGDIVKLAGDVPLHAVVVATARDAPSLARRGHLIVEPLNGGLSQRDVRTGDVTGHWRKAKR